VLIRVLMKLYELTYLISPELKEEGVQKILSNIDSLVQEEGGVVVENKKEKAVSLGYKIKGCKNGILAILKFRLEPEKQNSLQEKIKEKPEILRFVMEKVKPIKPKKVTLKPIKRAPKEKKEKKVELKGIEKKLEEILGE
jgi:ribosomal protein S6